MRRSRSDAAETRERIVSTASRMFLEKGLESVGMRDIMAAAGLTPGGFYRHFESKEQLIAEANAAAFDRLLTMFEAETAGKSEAEALEKIVSLYLNQAQYVGNTHICPLSMIGAELRHCEPTVREIAMNGYERLVHLLADCLPQKSRREALRAASGAVSTMVGAVMLSNIAPDKMMSDGILSDAHAAVRALLSPVSGVVTRQDRARSPRKRSVRG